MLLAALRCCCIATSGQDDIIVGGVTDTRRRPELQELVGYFLNSVVLRTKPQGRHAVPRLSWRKSRDTVVGALERERRAIRSCRSGCPSRSASSVRHPLFQVLFSIEPPMPDFADGWDLTQMDVTVGASKFDLYLELDERPEGMIGRFLYSTDLFDPRRSGA